MRTHAFKQRCFRVGGWGLFARPGPDPRTPDDEGGGGGGRGTGAGNLKTTRFMSVGLLCPLLIPLFFPARRGRDRENPTT
jgi:hypothetical protein